jgi:acyl-CoA reductase-like NAD-dependent aldehyde dehydrogenase
MGSILRIIDPRGGASKLGSQLRRIHLQKFYLLIDGQLTDGASNTDVINPATGGVVAAAPTADAELLNAAVSAAKRAFPAWSRRSMDARRSMLLAVAAAVEERFEEFSQLLTAEQGKPIAQARAEMGGTIALLRILASMELPVRILKEDAHTKVVEHRTPLGVVAAITPWNFPMILLAVKFAPALLVGNTLVIKPAPTTPLTTLLLGEICRDHLPPGVVNVITDRNDLGGQLTTHPDVAKVAFTGSTATGKKVMAGAAGSLKRLTLELGGNDVAIVLDDAQPALIAPQIFAGAMLNAGQVCLAIKRVYIHESLYEETCARLVELANAAVVGDGKLESTEIGPLQNASQFEKVKALIEESRREGKVIAGGEIPGGPGFFIRPTLIKDLPDTARLVREEQFGPVLPLLSYKTIDEVIDRANDSPYGLGGTIWSADPERALAVAMRLDTGIAWVNCHMSLTPDVAVGGSKQSGVGLEQGLEGLEEFTQRHVAWVAR